MPDGLNDDGRIWKKIISLHLRQGIKNVTPTVATKEKENKRPQAKCPPTFEMSICGDYVYNIYVKPDMCPQDTDVPALCREKDGTVIKYWICQIPIGP